MPYIRKALKRGFCSFCARFAVRSVGFLRVFAVISAKLCATPTTVFEPHLETTCRGRPPHTPLCTQHPQVAGQLASNLLYGCAELTSEFQLVGPERLQTGLHPLRAHAFLPPPRQLVALTGRCTRAQKRFEKVLYSSMGDG